MAGRSVNSFTKEGRSKEQNEAFDFLRRLLNWRKDQDVIHNGRLMHYIPEDNIYVYFRYHSTSRLMVIMNANDSAKTLDTTPFAESLEGVKKGREVLTQVRVTELKSIKIPAWTAFILELED